MVLLAFLAGLALVVIGISVAATRGVRLWRRAKRTGRAFSAELSTFEARTARTERLLSEADRSSRDLELALERLRASRARLQVLLDAVERAKRRTRWVRAFLPVP